MGLEAEEREVKFDEVKDFAECGLCGTAAVISPVGKIVDHGKEICFPSGMDEMGPITKKLYDTLTGIQMGVSKLQKAGFMKSCNFKLLTSACFSINPFLCEKVYPDIWVNFFVICGLMRTVLKTYKLHFF